METNNCLSFLSCSSLFSTNNCSTLLQTLLVYVRFIGNQPVDVSRFSFLTNAHTTLTLHELMLRQWMKSI